jgi:predicted nuclease of restriction endonuclease-like (RecB) superfamily
MNDLVKLNKEYVFLFNELKEKIRNTQLRAAVAVNQEMIGLYWEMGRQILEKQQQTQWGSKLIEVLSHDLLNTFPETRGFSVRNLQRMRQFAQFYQTLDFAAQAVPQLPWGHIVLLVQKIKEFEEREWYAQQAIEHGWSRTTLETYIKRNLYQQVAIENNASNFLIRLPSPQSMLAQDILKTPITLTF